MNNSVNNHRKKTRLAVVSQSSYFPVPDSGAQFWGTVLKLGGVVSGIMGSKWPFCDYLTAEDVKKIKGFVVKSGLLFSRKVPEKGVDIPAEVLQINDVIPVLTMHLTRQALAKSVAFDKKKVKPERIKVVIADLCPAPKSATQHSGSVSSLTQAFAAHHKCQVLQPESDDLSLQAAFAAALSELEQGSADLIAFGGTTGLDSSLLKVLNPTHKGDTPDKGFGAFVLRRLEDAEADKETVLAIIEHDSSAQLSVSATAQTEKMSQAQKPATLDEYVRLSPADLVVDSDSNQCLNIPFNDFRPGLSLANNPELLWKKLRTGMMTESCESRRFFHDLIGALFGTFVGRIIIQSPREFAAIADQPVIYMGNHQIGLESPLFMSLSYILTRKPVQAIAKPDHFNAWLSFLMDFAADSLGDEHPFHLLFFDKDNPMKMIDQLKRPGGIDKSLLVHVEGTRSKEAGHPVSRLSSTFLDVALVQNVPIVPVHFVGGLPPQAIIQNLDFPYNNGRQDYLIGAPIFPEALRSMPYGQRPKFVMNSINKLGPTNKEEDYLIKPNAQFVEQTSFFMNTFGMPKMQAMLFAVLGIIDDPSPETALLIKAVKSGDQAALNDAIPPVLKKFLSHMKTRTA